ncbi:hypothetical protein [Niallia sp. 03133]|uniref:hypothetical protein n=1 Tax=Niallia sp. 03133 TaxID=3458060 RepID=UPI004043BAD2
MNYFQNKQSISSQQLFINHNQTKFSNPYKYQVRLITPYVPIGKLQTNTRGPLSKDKFYAPLHNFYPSYPLLLYPIYNNNHSNWEMLRVLDVPQAAIFRTVSKSALNNRMVGGFPTFNWRRLNDYEVVFINPGYGEKAAVRNLDPSPADFTVHIQNVDRALRNDPRYLGGFPDFHLSTDKKLFGAIGLFKNAGVRRWVVASDLGYVESDSNEDRIKKAQNYAVRQGFAGGFPSFEHHNQYFELILLYKNAASAWYVRMNTIVR